MLRSPMMRGDALDVAAREHAAGRILRRVQDDQLGAGRDQARHLVHIHGEIALFAQRNRHRRAACVANHRLVDGKAGIGIDHFVALIDEREHDVKDDGLAAGNHNNFFGLHFDPAGAAHFTGDGLAQFGQCPRRGRSASSRREARPRLLPQCVAGFEKSGSPISR